MPPCLQDNPLYDNNTLLDTPESEGGERNPLYDSTSLGGGRALADERGQRNVLFGTDILDSLQGDHPRSRWGALLR